MENLLLLMYECTGGNMKRLNRRVSWVSSLREPVDRSRMTLASRLKKQKPRLPRQRSFSLESELELRTVAKRAVGVAGALQSIREARRSISLKSSPLHFPWHFRRESSSAMREGGVFAELRRSSEIFRNILLSIAGREDSTPTGLFAIILFLFHITHFSYIYYYSYLLTICMYVYYNMWFRIFTEN